MEPEIIAAQEVHVVGIDLNSLISIVFGFLTSNLGNVILSGGIGLWAIYLLFVGFLPKTRRIIIALNEANSKLTAVPDANAFTRDFEKQNGWLERHALLGGPWKEFSRTLIFPDSGASSQIIRNPAEPTEYFNISQLVLPNINLAFYQAVPNYLTGAGILGTFLGLVAGIYLASSGLTANDIGEVKNSLKPLLSGASLAFMTSIVGLVFSLIFSFVEKRKLHRLEKLIAVWNELLAGRLKRVTREELAAKELAEATLQTLHLERFNTDLAVSIADALDNKLTSSLAPLLQNLIAGVESLKVHQVDKQNEVLETLIKQFQSTVSGTAGTEMREMAAAFREMQKIMQGTAETLAYQQSSMKSTLEQITTRLGEVFSANAHSMENRLEKAMTAIFERLGQAGGESADKLTAGAHEVKSVLHEVAASLLASQKDLQERLSNFTAGMSGAIDSNSQKFQAQLEGVLAQLATHIGKAGTESAEVLSQVVSRSVEMIDTAARGLAVSIGKLDELVDSSDSKLQKYGELTNQFAQAFQELRRFQSDLAATALPIKDASQQLRISGEQVQNTMQLTAGLAGDLKQVVTQIQAVQQQTTRVWAEYQERFKGVDEALAKSFDHMSNGLKSFAEQLHENANSISSIFADAVNKLSAVISELDESVEVISETLPEGIKELNQAVKSIDQSVRSAQGLFPRGRV